MQIFNIIDRVLKYLSISALVSMILLVFFNAILRYFLGL